MVIDIMELSQINYFLALAETLNFTAAAQRSGISQPSLTKSIKRLEEELGGPLIYRDGKDTRLTALGRDMQMSFMRIASEVNSAHDLADMSIAGKRRVLSLGVAMTIAPTALSGFFQHVIEQMPAVELDILQMLPGENENEVLSGKYDMCLLTNPPPANFKLVSLPIFKERLMIGLATDHPLATQESLAPEDIAAETYIDRLHCEFRPQLVQHFMDRNIVMRPRIQSEREDWVQHLTATGVGVCAIPERSTLTSGITTRPVEGLTLSRDVALVAVSGSGTPKEVRQIIDLAKSFNWD